MRRRGTLRGGDKGGGQWAGGGWRRGASEDTSARVEQRIRGDEVRCAFEMTQPREGHASEGARRDETTWRRRRGAGPGWRVGRGIAARRYAPLSSLSTRRSVEDIVVAVESTANPTTAVSDDNVLMSAAARAPGAARAERHGRRRWGAARASALGSGTGVGDGYGAAVSGDRRGRQRGPARPSADTEGRRVACSPHQTLARPVT